MAVYTDTGKWRSNAREEEEGSESKRKEGRRKEIQRTFDEISSL